jgi:hypothetical protein
MGCSSGVEHLTAEICSSNLNAYCCSFLHLTWHCDFNQGPLKKVAFFYLANFTLKTSGNERGDIPCSCTGRLNIVKILYYHSDLLI